MNLLLDSNAILDFALHRDSGFEDMRKVWDAIADGLITGYVTTSSVTDIFYIASKGGKKPEDGYKVVAACLAALRVCAVTRQTLERAVMMKRKDFEDSVQIIAALAEGLDAIVTRDIKGFKNTGITLYTPEQLVKKLKLR